VWLTFHREALEKIVAHELRNFFHSEQVLSDVVKSEGTFQVGFIEIVVIGKPSETLNNVNCH
jgi:hypothetical protein